MLVEKNIYHGKAWWVMPIFLILGRLNQEDCHKVLFVMLLRKERTILWQVVSSTVLKLTDVSQPEM